MIATDSSLKSELPAIEGSAAPLWPSVPAPVSVSALSALSRLTFSGALPANCRTPWPVRQCGAFARSLLRLLLVLLVLFGLARGQNELEVHELVVAGGVEDRFLRSLREGRELGADDVAAVLGNIHLPRAGDVGGGGVALAGEGVLRGDGDAGQGNVAALYRAMQLAAGDGWAGCGGGNLRGSDRRGCGCAGWGRGLRPGRNTAGHNNPRHSRTHHNFALYRPLVPVFSLTSHAP